MTTNNALVLLWKGENLPDYLVKKVAEILITNGVCMPEMLTIKYKDENSVADALLRDTLLRDVNVMTVQKDVDEVAEAVKQAVIYIGRRFENSLTGANGPIGNIATFAIELSNAVSTAKRNMSFIGVGSKDELLTAIKILSETKAVIPSSLAKKYHFTQNVVDVIKKVYNATY